MDWAKSSNFDLKWTITDSNHFSARMWGTKVRLAACHSSWKRSSAGATALPTPVSGRQTIDEFPGLLACTCSSHFQIEVLTKVHVTFCFAAGCVQRTICWEMIQQNLGSIISCIQNLCCLNNESSSDTCLAWNLPRRYWVSVIFSD